MQNCRSKSKTAIIIASCLNVRRFQFFLPFWLSYFGLLIFFRRFKTSKHMYKSTKIQKMLASRKNCREQSFLKRQQSCIHWKTQVWHIKSHQTTCHRGCSFTHSASAHPSPPPPVVPTSRFQGPRPLLSTASTAAPAARSSSTTAVWLHSAATSSGVKPQVPKGSETSMAGGLHPVALDRPPPLQWEKLQTVE